MMDVIRDDDSIRVGILSDILYVFMFSFSV